MSDIYRKKETTIPQYDADPANPAAEDAWVKHSSSLVGAGEVLGLLAGITKPGTLVHTYQHSYRTKEGTTVRATLS